ncbi:hypothetical protein JRO89_XS03G0277700 [Xanthoceras sorbifolium]|uniref:Uncharacterized protein n=1 Tax=Xanthoceras sorbifolium TaxID=99658 RepID=A0ABQ8ICB9_9ROSI|nr:hypothetical protein JRO89_XS03G0277700 [Xanthoceras sorbifolium]
MTKVSSVKFTHLRTLRLQCLPQLTSFGLINEFMPDTRSQEILAEDEIGGFMLLFSQNVLEIFNCKFMEVVIITTRVRISNTLFPRLYWLHLNHLPEFTTFCKFAGNSIELPSLARLFIKNCPKMHTFVSNSPHADMPPTMEEQMNLEENLYTGIQPFFDEKLQPAVAAQLKKLVLRDLPKLKPVWDMDSQGSFDQLGKFGVGLEVV